MGTSFEKLDKTLKDLLGMVNGMYVSLGVAKVFLEIQDGDKSLALDLIRTSMESAIDKGFVDSEEVTKCLNNVLSKNAASLSKILGEFNKIDKNKLSGEKLFNLQESCQNLGKIISGYMMGVDSFEVVETAINDVKDNINNLGR